MTPRKAGRRKSGTARRKSAQRVKAFAVVSSRGDPISNGGAYLISTNKATATMNAKCYPMFRARVVPCEIMIGRKK